MRRAKRKTTVPPRPMVTARANERITAERVRVVDEDGTQVGVLPLAEALEHAAHRSLDLIEVAAEADPPSAVSATTAGGGTRRSGACARVGDSRCTRRRRRCGCGRGSQRDDYFWKRDQAIGFLRARSKVKLIVMFRGREREHPELGRQLLVRLAADAAEFGHLDGRESFEGTEHDRRVEPDRSGTMTARRHVSAIEPYGETTTKNRMATIFGAKCEREDATIAEGRWP